MKAKIRFLSLVLVLAFLASLLTGCTLPEMQLGIDELNITNGENVKLNVGDRYILLTDAPDGIAKRLKWQAVGDAVSVDENGIITAESIGVSVVYARYGQLSANATVFVTSDVNTDTDGDGANDGNTDGGKDGNTDGGKDGNTDGGNDGNTDGGNGSGITIDKNGNVTFPGGETVIPTADPYIGMTSAEFYESYKPATSNEDAAYRTVHGFMSGTLTVPDQAPILSVYQPSASGVLLRNSNTYFSEDRDTYTVVDAYGQKVMEIYRDGAYITLEEVAAYVYAFGDVPKNYVNDKKTKPTESKWGEYLRLNNTYFSGNTTKYPYEPVLPDISGCGGKLDYYEIDIGTTGTDCDPSYSAELYNDGWSITRGAARIVYVRYDENDDLVIDPNERYVFYTYNHYNDFQEYLNYYGGWGEMFGNITGGGTISSETNYNPTPYVQVVRKQFTAGETVSVVFVAILPRGEYL